MDLLCLDLKEVTVTPSENKALVVGRIIANQIPYLSSFINTVKYDGERCKTKCMMGRSDYNPGGFRVIRPNMVIRDGGGFQ